MSIHVRETWSVFPLRAILVLASLLSVAAPRDAFAFRRELGFSIEPMFLAFPAVAPPDSSGVALQTQNSVLTPSPAAAFSLEYYPLNYLSVVFRGGYAFAVVDTLIGEATFDNRTGDYWFRQSMGFGMLGVRIETPHYWTPVTFGFSAQAGLGLLIHTDTELRNAAGAKLRASPPTGVVPVPIIALSGPISGRVSEQVRLGVEPTLFLVPTNPVRVGFGVSLSLAIFFFV